MHSHRLERWQHPHSFLGHAHHRNERRARAVMVLTGVMMVAEIGAGSYYGSMALLADGWHMGTHLGAMAITTLAYLMARRHRENPAFTFGTGKFGDLAGFSSALILALVSLLIAYDSVTRLVQPVPIQYDAALLVAALGLVVNILSALILREDHGHGDSHASGAHGHAHGHAHEHAESAENHSRVGHAGSHGRTHAPDHNLRSAFLHVLADALMSIVALVALFCGRQWGWAWMDPAMGVVGSAIIAVWSVGLMRESGHVLLDGEADPEVAEHIRADVETGCEDRVADLHLWRVGPGHYAAVMTVVTHESRTPEYYKTLLSHHPELSHLTVEVQPCS